MPRPRRLELPGVPVHVVQRGVNHAVVFFTDADRRFYLRCLERYSARRGCAVHAYVLMGNHVHLLVTPQETGAIGSMLQDMGRKYVRVVNTLHDRTGTLWEGRFKSSLVDAESYFLACHRYIELNPVRAGLVGRPSDYAWSSHAHYALGQRNTLITEHPIHRGLGATDTERRAAFQALFFETLDVPTLGKIRIAVNSGCVLGSEAFAVSASAQAGLPLRSARRGRPSNSVAACESSEGVSGKLL